MQDVTLTPEQARQRLIRRADTVACKLAFIDCRMPGSDLKENYSLIGPGVTTSADQFVNISEPHGFNIGAAAMPHGIVNNLHLHFTAEVFMVLAGEWTFRWGARGDDGTVVGRAGDIISVPTWIFRGFTNTGPDDGWLMTTLGGDDTGGIIWHPDILRAACGHGLYLTADNRLVDTQGGQPKPPDDALIRPLTDREVGTLARWTPEQMRTRMVVAAERSFSRAALLDTSLPGCGSALASVIGHGMTQDRLQVAPLSDPHGFSMEWLRLEPGQSVSAFRLAQKQVLIAQHGGAEVTLNRGADTVMLSMAVFDTLSVPEGAWRSIRNPGDATVELIVVTAGDERKAPEFAPEVVQAALAAGVALDASGYVAPASWLPGRKAA